MSKKKAYKIVLVDDDPFIQEMVKDYVTDHFPNFFLKIYPTGEEALIGSRRTPDLIILDFELNGQTPAAANGLLVLPELKTRFPSSPIVMFTAQDNLQIATATVREGALDYIVKNETAMSRLGLLLRKIESDKSIHESRDKSKTLSIVLVGLIMLLIVIIVVLLMN